MSHRIGVRMSAWVLSHSPADERAPITRPCEEGGGGFPWGRLLTELDLLNTGEVNAAIPAHRARRTHFKEVRCEEAREIVGSKGVLVLLHVASLETLEVQLSAVLVAGCSRLRRRGTPAQRAREGRKLRREAKC